jgi:ankyrin repeat protein
LQGGDTPLITASYKGHVEVVALLLAVPSIDVNAADEVIAREPWDVEIDALSEHASTGSQCQSMQVLVHSIEM